MKRTARLALFSLILAALTWPFVPGPVSAQEDPTCTILGTEGDDVLVGTSGSDVICGLGGNDTISGGSGDDVIFGGAGDDVIKGGSGNDSIHGEDGVDQIDGGSGSDVIDGGAGDDVIDGGSGSDVIDGGAGDDVIDGGSGSDVIDGGAGDDILTGGSGNDDLRGGPGTDSAAGGSGTDVCAAETVTACEQVIPDDPGGPPEVSETSPTNGSTVPAGSTDVVVEFGSEMAEFSLHRALQIDGNVSGTFVPDQIDWDGASDSLLVTLPADLPDSRIVVSISEEAYAEDTGEALPGGFTFAYSIDQDPMVVSTNPDNGALEVSINRPLVVFFNGSLSGGTVSSGAVTASDGGSVVDIAVELDRTGERLFVYPEDMWPGGAAVEVTIDGAEITDSLGVLLDADGDGVPGGSLTVSFETVSTTSIPDTGLFGFVYDAYRSAPGGGDLPLEGVTIRIDGRPDLDATTDQNGQFVLQDLPAPEVFVHIDGSTAINPPAGQAYPSVGKPFHTLAGEFVRLQMQGEPFDIYLPSVPVADFQPLVDGQDTTLTLGPESADLLEEFAPEITAEELSRVAVDVQADSAVDRDGTPVDEAIVIPVPPERLPAPLPEGLEPELVISVQAPGAVRFDEPAPVTFPNLSGLLPGQKAALVSFNHDAGAWEHKGTATVSADGLTVVTDPGVGIEAPGWHWVWPIIRLVVSTDVISDPFDACAHPFYPELLDESQYPQVMFDALDDADAELQSIASGRLGSVFFPLPSTVNPPPPLVYDEYAMFVRMPFGASFDPEAFLDQLASDFKGTVASAKFDDQVSFERRGTGPPFIGDIYDLDIRGGWSFGPFDLVPDDGAIVTSGIEIDAAAEPDFFKASTIEIPGVLPFTRDSHPVSGTRAWGFEQISSDLYLFFTRAVEVPRGVLVLFGEGARAATWRAMLEALREQWLASGLDIGPTVDFSLQQGFLPECYEPPPGFVVEGDSPTVDPISGEIIHYAVGWVDDSGQERIVRATGTDPAERFAVQFLLPSFTNYTAYAYDPGSNQFGRAIGRTVRSGTIFVVVRLQEDAGPDVDGNGVSDIADFIIGPPPVVDDGGNGST